MPTVQEVLAVARKEVGVKESPANSNKTKYGKWYGMNGKPWCMIFIMWVFSRSGGEDLLPTLTASCGDFMKAAKKAGRWITRKYRVGDVVIFDFPGGGRTDHVGIVERVTAKYLYTIEGNTSSGNNCNGGMVMRRSRKPSLVVGGFRPRYAGEKAEAAETKKSGFSIGSLVSFIGSKLYIGSGQESVSTPAASCTVTVSTVQAGAAHPYYVRADNGMEGWVDASDLRTASGGGGSSAGNSYPMKVKITAKPSLRVRSGPSINYAQLFSLQHGAVVTVTEVRCGWGKLEEDGWISMKYTAKA